MIVQIVQIGTQVIDQKIFERKFGKVSKSLSVAYKVEKPQNQIQNLFFRS